MLKLINVCKNIGDVKILKKILMIPDEEQNNTPSIKSQLFSILYLFSLKG